MERVRIDRLIEALLFTPTRRGWCPAFTLWGPPGTAKTSIVNDIARRWGLPLVRLSPGEMGEGAFGVVPVPVVGPTGARVLEYPAPDWTARVAERGVLFVDELTTAPPALQPPLLGLTLDGVIGSMRLAPGVRIVSAANPVSMATAGYDLSLAQANRLIHIDIAALSESGEIAEGSDLLGGHAEWVQWLTGGGTDETAPGDPSRAMTEEERVLSRWSEDYAYARGLVAAFIQRRPQALHRQPQPNNPAASRAWPSRRSWETATRMIATARCHNLNDFEAEALIIGCIGTATAGEFATFRASADLVDPVAVLDGAVEWHHDPTRLDRTNATLMACLSVVAPRDCKRREERAAVLCDIVVAVGERQADIVQPVVNGMMKAGVADFGKLQKVMTRLGYMMGASNQGR